MTKPPSPHSAPVRVVTDSTASLPPHLIRSHGIEVVPLHVLIDGESFLEGIDCSPEQIGQALRDGAQVSTSQPTPEQFREVFTRLAQEGAQEIVSIHLSGALSGTVATAQSAALESPVPVRVVDSRTVAMGLGFAALAAARVAVADNETNSSGNFADTAGPEGTEHPDRTAEIGPAGVGARATLVAAAAHRAARSAQAIFLVDSLEHLRRGGRLGRTASTVGTLLGLRPLLTLEAGEITVLAKVRTKALALDRIFELLAAHAEEFTEPAVAVHHVDDEETGAELARRLAARTGAEVTLNPVSAVLAAHVGPGLIAAFVGDGSAEKDPS